MHKIFQTSKLKRQFLSQSIYEARQIIWLNYSVTYFPKKKNNNNKFKKMIDTEKKWFWREGQRTRRKEVSMIAAAGGGHGPGSPAAEYR